MSQELWSKVDNYIIDSLAIGDPVLHAAAQATADADMPDIAVSPTHGAFLNIIAKTAGARKILEIGTLGGYSTISLARALPEDGKLITLEYSAKHAEVAQANIDRAGLTSKVGIKVGAALDTLPSLENEAPFDLFFLDADKENNAAYYEYALRYSRPGSLIIVDNAVRGGGIADPSNTSPAVQGTRRLYENAGKDVDVTAIQTVGVKGHDGFFIARVR